MAFCSSPKLVTKCNTSHVYADFRRTSQKNRGCTGKKIFEFLFFLVLLRFFLDFPAAQATLSPIVIRGIDFENNPGSGDGLARKSRQILKPRKSFFATVRASESERDEMIKAVSTDVNNSDTKNSKSSEKKVLTTVLTTSEVNFTEIPVDLTAKFGNNHSVQFTSISQKSAGQNNSQGLYFFINKKSQFKVFFSKLNV